MNRYVIPLEISLNKYSEGVHQLSFNEVTDLLNQMTTCEEMKVPSIPVRLHLKIVDKGRDNELVLLDTKQVNEISMIKSRLNSKKIEGIVETPRESMVMWVYETLKQYYIEYPFFSEIKVSGIRIKNKTKELTFLVEGALEELTYHTLERYKMGSEETVMMLRPTKERGMI